MFKSFPPPLGGWGDRTAMFGLSLRCVPPRSILCRYQPPLPLPGDFVSSLIWTGGGGGGKVESACSLLFCDRTRLGGTTVHRAAAFKPATHHRRRMNPACSQRCARSPGWMRTAIIVGIVPDLTFLDGWGLDGGGAQQRFFLDPRVFLLLWHLWLAPVPTRLHN